MKNLITILAILAVLVTPAMTFAAEPLADPVKVTVRVDGLSCPFCAYGLEKKVKRMEGVEEVSINVERGTVEVEFSDGKFFVKETLEEAVKDAGFTPREIRVEDIGE